MYDYNLGRFYSVDPIIQAPGNSQSLNPYSYIMNNPLAGTDPTGYTAECVEKEKCLDQPKRSNRSGRGFAQEVYQVYQRPNNGAEQNTGVASRKTETTKIGAPEKAHNSDRRRSHENAIIRKETGGTGRLAKPKELEMILKSIPDAAQQVTEFIEMLESGDSEWFDEVMKAYGYDSIDEFENERASILSDSR